MNSQPSSVSVTLFIVLQIFGCLCQSLDNYKDSVRGADVATLLRTTDLVKRANAVFGPFLFLEYVGSLLMGTCSAYFAVKVLAAFEGDSLHVATLGAGKNLLLTHHISFPDQTRNEPTMKPAQQPHTLLLALL